jgi:diguanylate cyclase (GGDEF)-like protein
VAVVFVDLDDFKVVNDSLGHAVGDRLLVAVAQRLREALQPDDLLARFGGDEFVICLSGLTSERDAQRVADRIGASLAAPLVLGAEGIEVPEQAAILQHLRCTIGQGFHFAHPQEPAAITRLVSEGRVDEMLVT